MKNFDCYFNASELLTSSCKASQNNKTWVGRIHYLHKIPVCLATMFMLSSNSRLLTLLKGRLALLEPRAADQPTLQDFSSRDQNWKRPKRLFRACNMICDSCRFFLITDRKVAYNQLFFQYQSRHLRRLFVSFSQNDALWCNTLHSVLQQRPPVLHNNDNRPIQCILLLIMLV